VIRHACGLADVGRWKTRAVRDLLLDRNPACVVHPHEADIEAEPALLEELVAAADLVLAATDSPPSRILINRACLRQGRIGVFAGMVPRTYAGDVLRVRPGEGPCYECVHYMWTRHQAPEIPHAGEDGEYGHEMPVPGSSVDLLPVVIHQVKLCLVELTRGTPWADPSLEEDLAAALYVWANRREGEYRNLHPLGYGVGALAVLRWFGIRLPPVPDCPGCSGMEPGPAAIS
jgi:molybdopterin-synthase adenylyltransferase